MNSLLVAAQDGDLENVRALILAGADVNEKDELGWTTLHYSSDMNHVDIVKALISAGADVNSINEHGFTALHRAALEGHEEVVKELISARADVNRKGKREWTALHSSSCFGHTNIVKMLIFASAHINEKDKDGWTPLHYSAKNGQLDITKALISAGADVNAKVEGGHIALHHSVMNWNFCSADIVKALISSGAEVNAKDEEGNTPLVYCAKQGHTEIIKALISAGADASVVNTNEESFFDLVSGPNVEAEACIKYTLLYQIRPNLKKLLELRNDVFYQIWNKCEKQVENMKESRLGGSCTSFYEFLTETRENKLALYTYEENFGLKNDFEINSYIEKFDMYADEIETQFKKGRERANLLQKSQVFLKLCFCDTLPPELIIKICEKMPNADMENFLDLNNILRT